MCDGGPICPHVDGFGVHDWVPHAAILLVDGVCILVVSLIFVLSMVFILLKLVLLVPVFVIVVPFVSAVFVDSGAISLVSGCP